MIICRGADAVPQTPPAHFGMTSLTLSPPANGVARVALSHYLPDGHTEMLGGATPKLYVVIAGEVTVTLEDGRSEVLRRLDSCLIAANEVRQVRNQSVEVASMLVIMPE